MSQIPEPAKFKETREKNVLHKPWPKHIPDSCPECRTSMKHKVNLFHARNRLANLIRSVAPWISIVVLVSVLIFMGFAPPSAVEGGRGSPMALIAMIVGPSIILTILANCIPKVYKLQCHSCQFTKNFPRSGPRDDHHQA